MKATIVIFFYILIAASSQLNAQNMQSQTHGLVQYDYYIDTLAAKTNLEDFERNNPDAYKQYGNQFEKINNYTNDLKFTLKLRDDESYFSVEEGIIPDNLMEQLIYKAAIIAALHSKEGFYVKHSEKKFSFFTEIAESRIEVVQPFNNCAWSLTGKRKFSQGRTLMEATCMFQLDTRPEGEKTLVRAWYDPSISLPFGPAQFHGLPGLILELYIESKETRGYIATHISVHKGKGAPLKLPKIIATLTAEEYASKVIESSGN